MKYPIRKEFRWLRFVHMTKNLSLLKLENIMVGLMYHLQPVGRDIGKKRISIPTRDGSKINVDLFYPKNIEGPYKTLIYFPGGGFLMRASHYHIQNLCDMVNHSQIMTIMVHYRLAPKHPFPTFFYDAVDVINYLFLNHQSLNIDPNHIGLGGDSAGGNIACGLALYNRDYLKHSIQSLLLIYPGLAKGITNYSRKIYIDTPMFNASMFPLIEKVVYKNGTKELDRYAFPLEHHHLEGLGNIYIETAEFDCLRDDGTDFYERLIKTNATVTLNKTFGTVHGYDIVKKSPITKASKQMRCEFIRNSL